jgi:hypothetical protein
VKKLAKQLLVATLMALYAASGTAFADESEDVRLRGYCDIVFFCQTTKMLDMSPDGTVNSLPNEAFRFAIKDSQLLVPKGASVLGDGTANWDLTSGYCSEETPKDLQLNFFEAELFNGTRSLKFNNGIIQFADVTHQSRTRVWFATCDRFD